MRRKGIAALFVTLLTFSTLPVAAIGPDPVKLGGLWELLGGALEWVVGVLGQEEVELKVGPSVSPWGVAGDGNTSSEADTECPEGYFCLGPHQTPWG